MSTKPKMRTILVPRDSGNIKKADIKAAVKAVKAQRLAGTLPKSKDLKSIHLHIPKWA